MQHMPQNVPELPRRRGDVTRIHPHRPLAAALIHAGVGDVMFLPGLGYRHQPLAGRWRTKGGNDRAHVVSRRQKQVLGGVHGFRMRRGERDVWTAQNRPHPDLIQAPS